MRISDGSSDVCSSDLHAIGEAEELQDVRGLAGRVGGELHRVLGHAELVVAKQLQAVAHRADRPDQIMAEARDTQLGHTNVDIRLHYPAAIPRLYTHADPGATQDCYASTEKQWGGEK